MRPQSVDVAVVPQTGHVSICDDLQADLVFPSICRWSLATSVLMLLYL